MCLTCGCGDEDNVRITSRDSGHDHPHPHGHPGSHDHDHDHDHDHESIDRLGHAELHRPPTTETLVLGERILAKNDHLAAHNRQWLTERGILALNLMSSPGSGKTALLERTITALRDDPLTSGSELLVIEGDQETTFDADRITRAGARAVQVNTGGGCHLDAPMVQRALEVLDPRPGSVVFVENVGNLVCPALFDVGESAKVVIISVTEGDDKPLKYPQMFAAADLVVINKVDLLPYVDFDLGRLEEQARSLQPDVEVIALSVRSGANVTAWLEWLRDRVALPMTRYPQPPATGDP